MSAVRRNAAVIRSPTGSELTAGSWATEAPLRMLMNNLDPDVAERPEELVVYGGIGRAARNWNATSASSPRSPRSKATKRSWCRAGSRSASSAPTGDAPRVLIANSNIVANWATLDHFTELDRAGLMCTAR